MTKNTKIGVIGGGSWATAIVKMLCNNVDNVLWWIRNDSTVDFIKKYNHNPNYLSSVEFDIDKLTVKANLKEIVAEADVLIMAVPAAFLMYLPMLSPSVRSNFKGW